MEFEGSKSYIAIMTAAKTLFWKYGIKRVTVEEICKAAGVSKMTFYRSFKNKSEPACAIMERLFENGMRDYKAIMSKEIPFPEKIKLLIDMKQEGAKDISEEFIHDIFTHDIPELKQLMTKQVQLRNKAVMQDFAEAQKNGWIRRDLKLEFILYTLNELTAKMSDEKFLALFENGEDAISEITNYFFYGILSNQPK